MTPSIAVIIPAYNAEATLESTVTSLLSQSIQDWEAVIVDDGSSDRTFEVASRLADADPRVAAITQPNAGVSAARNAGIQKTHAPILGFLDADDQWLPPLAERIVATFDSNPGAGVVFCRAEIRDSNGEPTGIESSFPDRPVDLELLVATNPASTCSTMSARRSTIDATGGFDEDLRRCEDHHFLLSAYLNGHEVVGIDEALVAYRTSPDGLSANLEGMLEGWEAMVAKIGPERLGPTVERARAEHLFYLARRALRLGRLRDTFNYLRLAFATDISVPFRKIGSAPGIIIRRALARRGATP